MRGIATFRGTIKNRVKARILLFLRYWDNGHTHGLSAREIHEYLPSVSQAYLDTRLPIFAGNKPGDNGVYWSRPLVLSRKRPANGSRATMEYRISADGRKFLEQIPPWILPKIAQAVDIDLGITEGNAGNGSQPESATLPKQEVKPEPAPAPKPPPAKYLCWITFYGFMMAWDWAKDKQPPGIGVKAFPDDRLIVANEKSAEYMANMWRQKA